MHRLLIAREDPVQKLRNNPCLRTTGTWIIHGPARWMRHSCSLLLLVVMCLMWTLKIRKSRALTLSPVFLWSLATYDFLTQQTLPVSWWKENSVLRFLLIMAAGCSLPWNTACSCYSPLALRRKTASFINFQLVEN